MSLLPVAFLQAEPVPLAREAAEGEEIFDAELDLSEIGQGLASLDTDRHCSRPDVFELNVDTRAKDGVNWA
jgi:nitrilase